MSRQAARARILERSVELVGEQPLRSFAPAAPGQREGGAAERLARSGEGLGQLRLGDARLGAHLRPRASDEVHQGERLAGGLVDGRQRGLDVRERLAGIDGPGRALGDGSEGGTLHRGRGYP